MTKRPTRQPSASRPARPFPPPAALEREAQPRQGPDGDAAENGETDLDACIARMVDDAPPLTSEQRDRLALILDPGGLFTKRRARYSIRLAPMAMILSAAVLPPSRPQNGYVMSMQPAAWPEPDPQIAAAIAAMYGSRKTERPLAVEVRDRLGQWLADEDFAAAFRGPGGAGLGAVAAGAGDRVAAGGEAH